MPKAKKVNAYSYGDDWQKNVWGYESKEWISGDMRIWRAVALSSLIKKYLVYRPFLTARHITMISYLHVPCLVLWKSSSMKHLNP